MNTFSNIIHYAAVVLDSAIEDAEQWVTVGKGKEGEKGHKFKIDTESGKILAGGSPAMKGKTFNEAFDKEAHHNVTGKSQQKTLSENKKKQLSSSYYADIQKYKEQKQAAIEFKKNKSALMEKYRQDSIQYDKDMAEYRRMTPKQRKEAGKPQTPVMPREPFVSSKPKKESYVDYYEKPNVTTEYNQDNTSDLFGSNNAVDSSHSFEYPELAEDYVNNIDSELLSKGYAKKEQGNSNIYTKGNKSFIVSFDDLDNEESESFNVSVKSGDINTPTESSVLPDWNNPEPTQSPVESQAAKDDTSGGQNSKPTLPAAANNLTTKLKNGEKQYIKPNGETAKPHELTIAQYADIKNIPIEQAKKEHFDMLMNGMLDNKFKLADIHPDILKEHQNKQENKPKIAEENDEEKAEKQKRVFEEQQRKEHENKVSAYFKQFGNLEGVYKKTLAKIVGAPNDIPELKGKKIKLHEFVEYLVENGAKTKEGKIGYNKKQYYEVGGYDLPKAAYEYANFISQPENKGFNLDGIKNKRTDFSGNNLNKILQESQYNEVSSNSAPPTPKTGG